MRVCFITSALPAPAAIAEYARRLDADVAQRAPDGEYDVAVATDWAATAHLFEARAARHAFWVDHFAHRRMGTWQAERFAAQLAYDLPVDFIAAAPLVTSTHRASGRSSASVSRTHGAAATKSTGRS